MLHAELISYCSLLIPSTTFTEKFFCDYYFLFIYYFAFLSIVFLVMNFSFSNKDNRGSSSTYLQEGHEAKDWW